jgi:hypothetical protein
MFQMRCKREFGFQTSTRSSFLGAVVYLGRLRLQTFGFKSHRLGFLSKTAHFQLSSFWLGFKSQGLCRILRCCFESLLWKARCSRLYEEFVEIQCFARSVLVGDFGNWHVYYEQPGSVWWLRKIEFLHWKARCSRLHEYIARVWCFTKLSRVIGFERWHVWPEKTARKCIFAMSLPNVLQGFIVSPTRVHPTSG